MSSEADTPEVLTTRVLLYIAPGGMQTYLKKSDGQRTRIKSRSVNPIRNVIYKPCVDETFKSIAESCL